MQVAFRTDASLQIGTGHVMRCLTLADELRERGAQSSFICREHEGNLLALIRQRGHEALGLPSSTVNDRLLFESEHAAWLGVDWPTDADQTRRVLGSKFFDWLVVDHYALGTHWEAALRSSAQRIMVIDDLADRPHACDLLLDQNLGRTEKDYNGLLKGSPIALLGPRYALLRPEFAGLRAQSLVRRQGKQRLSRLLITMGGVDKDNATGQVLAALRGCVLPTDLHIIVVMGSHSPWLAQVQAQAVQMPCITEVLVGVNNMAQIMAGSDLAIGAAGGTTWERCSLGLPSVIVVLAQNQMAGSVALQNSGAAIELESFRQIAEFVIEMQKKEIANIVLERLSRAAAAVTDGEGVGRVADYMLGGVLA